ncbi:MAG: glycosyltransferase [Proteobacteria bacterium]|nr:glycosyltransferase [Pseudomonadota bacterium]MDA0927245.1 glycosyltransferase [Pseudomonadota bacterium]
MSQAAPATSGDSAPYCTIIIPTRDQLQFLKTCVDGVLASTAEFPFELVIVDNGSEQQATLDYLQSIRQHERVRVLAWQQEFNFSAINNFAVEHCSSELLCFLNNDIEIIDTHWLNELAEIAARDDVGAVGCRLLYPDNRIQHAGVALDEESVARHIALGEAADYLQQQGLLGPVAVDAVTAACMMMRREVFQRLGGFDEDNLAVSYNDVDLCLRITELGLPVLMHPGVAHIHHESVSRQSDELDSNRPRALAEFNYMKGNWAHRLAGHNYAAGLPAGMQVQAAISDDLDRVITQTLSGAEQTRLEDLQGGHIRSVAVRNTAGDTFHQLEVKYNELQAHTQRLEEAHRLIENSIFWRMTAPLRALRDLLSGRGRKQGKQATGQPLVRSTAPAGGELNATDIDSRPGDRKAEHDAEARHLLDKFLASDKKIRFPAVENPEISILLVFYNNAPLSLLCLQSILEHGDVSYEVIIVDNHSSDDTNALLDRLENATVLRNEDNLGFVKAVNQGAKQARGRTLLLLNNDAELEAQCLSAALSTLDSADDIGAVGGKINLLDGSLQEAGSIIWADGACLGYGRHGDPDAGEYNFRRDVDYCSGAFLLFSTSLFNEMGGFDEAYAPAYYEESDFCVRLWERGLRVVYEPRAVITHYEFASSGGISGASKLQQEHRQILCDKHADFLAKQKANDSTRALYARTANHYPNVLIIDDRVPYPSLGAGYPRCCHILNTLADMPVNVTFYPLLYPNDRWQDIHEILPAETEVILERGQAGLGKFLEERQGFYHTIMISRVHNMEIFNAVIKETPAVVDGCRIVYDAEAVTAPREVLRRRLWGEQVSSEEEQRLIETELQQAKDADCVLAVSEQESELYRQQGIDNTAVLGHTMAVRASASSFAQRHGLLFVGALRDEGSPNVDSLLWFLVNCLPRIEQALPDTRLYVVGDNTAPSLATVVKDNVVFTGRLDSIAEIYEQCRVFIAPTRFAAGIPHKIHEAAGNGIPSVATSLLARQLGWNDGKELLVADSAELFASQCLQLLGDETLWKQIQQGGLQAVGRDCSDENFRRSLAHALQLDVEAQA